MYRSDKRKLPAIYLMSSNKLHIALGCGNEIRITKGRSFPRKTITTRPHNFCS